MIYKRGGVYWFKLMRDGVLIRESTQSGNLKVARDIEAKYKANLAEDRVGFIKKAKAITFNALAERFLLTHSGHRAATASFYAGMVRSLLRYEPFDNLPIDQIDSEAIQKYIEHRSAADRQTVIRKKDGTHTLRSTGRPITVAQVNREIATLRRMLNLAVEWKLLDVAPKFHLLAGEQNRERVLSQAEETAYLEAASEDLRAYAIVALDTGLRPGEIFMLEWQNIRFDSGFIRSAPLVGGTKKRPRNVPMTARVRELLQTLQKNAASSWVFPGTTPEGYTDYWQIKSAHDRAIKKMGGEGFTLYVLRHTFLTRLGESGADSFVVKAIAGHTSLTTTARYVHLGQEHLDAAVSQLQKHGEQKANN